VIRSRAVMVIVVVVVVQLGIPQQHICALCAAICLYIMIIDDERIMEY